MFSVPMTKRRAERGGGFGRERAEEEAEVVEVEFEEEAVLAEALAASILLILSSISTRLLCHCLRRGKRRSVPDATLGTETKMSRWFAGGMGLHEEEMSPQHSVDAPAVLSITSGLVACWTSRKDRGRRGDRPASSASGDERILDRDTNPVCVHRWMMKSASDAEPYSSSRVLFKKTAGFFTM